MIVLTLGDFGHKCLGAVVFRASEGQSGDSQANSTLSPVPREPLLFELR